MAKKKEEVKIELEREYVIPIKRKVIKAQRYKRAKKAIRIIREFLAKHMRVEERDLKKIKIDKYLNHEIWFRGIKNPPSKIKVKAIKRDGIVYAELVDIPEKVKWDMERDKKKAEAMEKVGKKKVEKPAEEKPVESEEKKEEAKEKEEASADLGLKAHQMEAKEMKHMATGKHMKNTTPFRQSLKK